MIRAFTLFATTAFIVFNASLSTRVRIFVYLSELVPACRQRAYRLLLSGGVSIEFFIINLSPPKFRLRERKPSCQIFLFPAP
jgi:hypothetical protein